MRERIKDVGRLKNILDAINTLMEQKDHQIIRMGFLALHYLLQQCITFMIILHMQL